MSAPLLEVVDLVTHFRAPRGTVRAVDGVSFSVERGKALGIVGESGSGKSVLSRTIIGILAKDGSVVTRGKILFEGRDLLSLSEPEMRNVRGKDIAMVFQDPMSSLNPVKRIGAQIGEVLTRHLGLRGRDADARSVELLTSVGIPSARVTSLAPMKSLRARLEESREVARGVLTQEDRPGYSGDEIRVVRRGDVESHNPPTEPFRIDTHRRTRRRGRGRFPRRRIIRAEHDGVHRARHGLFQ